MLDQAKNVFAVGIKGAAMANLAIILQKMGKNVTGSDIEEEFITDVLLKKNKISWQIGFKPKKLPANIDLMVYSAAHQGDKNPQVIEAKKRNIKILHQAELLGQLIKQFKTSIAVCGCHGKTTSSSLLSYALIKLGAKPSYMIGSSNFNEYFGGDFNGTDYFIVEADEYGVNPPHDLTPKFHFLNPDYILCTNIDFDHPDVYKNLKEVENAFSKFFKNKKLIFCADDQNITRSIDRSSLNQYLSYGFSNKADLQIINYKSNSEGTVFSLKFNIKSRSSPLISKARDYNLSRIDSGVPFNMFRIPRMTIKLFGEKNVSNAAGVILTLHQLGFKLEKIKSAIKDFTGAKRRFELVYKKKGTYLFDDYAHHPNEIKATISAARSRFPKKRIVVIFQPHTYSRTQKLLNDFAKSLSLADQTVILPIFASARENPLNFNITSKDMVKFNPDKLNFIESKQKLNQYLISNIQYQDIIFTMGAGDVYKLSGDIIKIIKSL
ncbi:UDP-N-acetylmuramate--L-alanine ligase [Candidatus Roizmanbacteria bacterium RIFCSPHIGHO2_01_FULL_35_10]|uniref:UDP-N-acetylmuramate--L-alanine ligase n=1 Tax=Candidatus Roizmanbacteria bacterium RIFCSPLOWO2_01_FULL_35_13 TaxID=1802055 RepID=A0A1F7IHA0_9BACT|nr:MAG: UDP-N-acetylmuramate--L-alanine ligase [Candidatus Roizmanbacteria bacterium RIFCSPHIGHO2_01_FULL_35_10]OGK42749.1 MAG: UDP-N-acetylmuramate--L-alanine ligase [Candidatus Roizmanbacteria bacterium RIFCSPLOWO2_01_FULL_35_13]